MIVAIVQIPMPRRSRADALHAGESTAATFSAMKDKGLLKKYYLNGDAGGGGVYLWRTLAQAQALYTPAWEASMEKRFGAKPTVTYYESLVQVDNELDEVRVERGE